MDSMSGMSMDMPMSTTSMDMGSPTTTTAATATSTAMSMGGMNMGGSNSCKISMLWNWHTIDACFISSSWHVTSKGMFAGSCIGVILLGMCLELLRRGVKEYDNYLVRKSIQARSNNAAATTVTSNEGSNEGNESGRASPKSGPQTTAASAPTCSPAAAYRPAVWEQAIRALLHTAQFVVAYFLMLLAMYYNGYIIICIFIGAYIGAFIFQWEKLGGGQQTSASKEATVCCG